MRDPRPSRNAAVRIRRNATVKGVQDTIARNAERWRQSLHMWKTPRRQNSTTAATRNRSTHAPQKPSSREPTKSNVQIEGPSRKKDNTIQCIQYGKCQDPILAA